MAPPPPAGETLGQRVRKLRRRRGLSLAQVAGSEFSRAFLNQVEMDRSQPSTRVLRVIADRLGAPLDYLVEGRRGLERELGLEQARLALARGRPRRALSLLRPIAGEGAEEAGLYARALAASGRLPEAVAALAGLGPMGAAEHVRAADGALRDDDLAGALEHFRSARVLYEADSMKAGWPAS